MTITPTAGTRLARAPIEPLADVGARVLVGLDGSPESLVAARQAATLAGATGTLRFVAAVSVAAATPPAFGTVAVLHELEHAADEALAEARERWPRGSTVRELGPAADVLLDEAKREGATLVAVGAQGRRRLPGIVLGHVTTHLLHRSPCSVLVARERDGGIAFPRTIVAGTDGSPEANAAVRVARSLGERFGAPVRVVVATGGAPVDVDGLAEFDRLEWSESAPVEALVEAAAGADLVVVGGRGLRGLRALGSTSERVGHAAPCSVLAVRGVHH